MVAQRKLSHPVHLTLDWDSTLTVNDTLSTLARLPKARDARLGLPQRPTHTWDDFAKAYMDDYSAHKRSSSLYPTTSDPHKYREWLASLHTVEYQSAKRVSDSGFFRGVTTADIVTVAQAALDTGEVQLRSGWQDLFGFFLPAASPPDGSNLSILSVNWSAAFIRSSLRCAAQAVHGDESRRQLVQYVDEMEIQANEIAGLDEPTESSSGLLIGSIRTAADKLQNMPLVRAQDDKGILKVYVGDSATDYECLRHADVGIWICECPESDYEQRFRDTFKPLDLGIRPIGQYDGETDRLCWASKLEQVTKMLVGYEGARQDP